MLWIMWWIIIFVLHDFFYVNYIPECCLNITNKETLQDLDKETGHFENNGKWLDYPESLDKLGGEASL